MKLFLTFLILFKIIYQKDNWHNLKLKLEYSDFEREAKSYNISQNVIDFMTKNILVIVKEYIYNTFKVKEKQEIDLEFYINKNKYDLEKKFGKILSGNDWILKIISFNSKSNVLAQATPLGFNIDTRRPNIGLIWINLFYLKKIKEKEINQYFQKNLLTMMHETFHILGFNSIGISNLKIFSKFNVKENNYKLSSKKVLEYGKKQFGCNNLKSLFFENNKSPHWEVLQFGSDVEIAISKRNLKISEMTLAYFEDLGWYKVDYDMSEILPFGLKKGCEFINNPSIKFEEFSNKKSYTCSNDYTSIAYYLKTQFTGNLFVKSNIISCGIKDKNKNSCIEILNYHPKCVESKCIMKENKLLVKYFLNNFEIICSKNEQIIEKKGFKIKCPNIERFCEYKYECKDNCNGKGFCLNGNCICNKNFKGIACEFDNKKEINSYKNNKKCNFNGYYKNKKCICYNNYRGNNCENILINKGSFSTNCHNSVYVKCNNNDYYNYLNKKNISSENEVKEKKSINNKLNIDKKNEKEKISDEKSNKNKYIKKENKSDKKIEKDKILNEKNEKEKISAKKKVNNNKIKTENKSEKINVKKEQIEKEKKSVNINEKEKISDKKDNKNDELKTENKSEKKNEKKEQIEKEKKSVNINEKENKSEKKNENEKISDKKDNKNNKLKTENKNKKENKSEKKKEKISNKKDNKNNKLETENISEKNNNDKKNDKNKKIEVENKSKKENKNEIISDKNNNKNNHIKIEKKLLQQNKNLLLLTLNFFNILIKTIPNLKNLSKEILELKKKFLDKYNKILNVKFHFNKDYKSEFNNFLSNKIMILTQIFKNLINKFKLLFNRIKNLKELFKKSNNKQNLNEINEFEILFKTKIYILENKFKILKNEINNLNKNINKNGSKFKENKNWYNLIFGLKKNYKLINKTILTLKNKFIKDDKKIKSSNSKFNINFNNKSNKWKKNQIINWDYDIKIIWKNYSKKNNRILFKND